MSESEKSLAGACYAYPKTQRGEQIAGAILPTDTLILKRGEASRTRRASTTEGAY
ncbi:MAG: hypothetical protein K2L67_04905 [Clostridia bacterium]|nr:hypothetical protein [Clostridia bacterium]